MHVFLSMYVFVCVRVCFCGRERVDVVAVCRCLGALPVPVCIRVCMYVYIRPCSCGSARIRENKIHLKNIWMLHSYQISVILRTSQITLIVCPYLIFQHLLFAHLLKFVQYFSSKTAR